MQFQNKQENRSEKSEEFRKLTNSGFLFKDSCFPVSGFKRQIANWLNTFCTFPFIGNNFFNEFMI